jgi:hypothetical protein
MNKLLTATFALVATLNIVVGTGHSALGQATVASTTPSSTPSTTNAPLAETSFKGAVRDLHENLKRVEGNLQDLEREAGRRQIVANSLLNNDTFISDPWDACMPANLAGLRDDSTRQGPYLVPRKSFLDMSLTSLASLNSSMKEIITALPALNTAGEKVKVDIDVMSDARASFEGKLADLKTLCQADSPDNASILVQVHTIKEIVDGMNRVGKNLWKNS